jgi:hypothetical protein
MAGKMLMSILPAILLYSLNPIMRKNSFASEPFFVPLILKRFMKRDIDHMKKPFLES